MATAKQLRAEVKQLNAELKQLENKIAFVKAFFTQGAERHRREGFHNGQEKHDWLVQQMREHPEMSQQDIERTLLPLRTPLDDSDAG